MTEHFPADRLFLIAGPCVLESDELNLRVGEKLARLAEKPDITLRALQAELAERGLKVSCYAVWHFFEHEGISFKKKPARQRAGSARRGKAARTVEEVPRAA